MLQHCRRMYGIQVDSQNGPTRRSWRRASRKCLRKRRRRNWEALGSSFLRRGLGNLVASERLALCLEEPQKAQLRELWLALTVASQIRHR